MRRQTNLRKARGSPTGAKYSIGVKVKEKVLEGGEKSGLKVKIFVFKPFEGEVIRRRDQA